MTLPHKLLLMLVAAIILSLAACQSNPAFEELPTPTPVDAALLRLTAEAEETTEMAEDAAAADAGAADAGAADTGAADTESADAGAEPAQVFVQTGCTACHAVEGDGAGMLGPSLAGIASKSAEVIEADDYTGDATTAEEYIRESIVNPMVYLVEGYQPVMPANYGDTLSDEQLNELVDYLLTLE